MNVKFELKAPSSYSKLGQDTQKAEGFRKCSTFVFNWTYVQHTHKLVHDGEGKKATMSRSKEYCEVAVFSLSFFPFHGSDSGLQA